MVSHLVVVEAGIGRYNRILRLNGQREVEAVMDRVVEVARDRVVVRNAMLCSGHGSHGLV